MTNLCGIYYLHTNGDLIYKRYIPEDLHESSFIKAHWHCAAIGRTPMAFQEFLLQALEEGARPERVLELYNHNHLDAYLPKELADTIKETLNARIAVGRTKGTVD